MQSLSFFIICLVGPVQAPQTISSVNR